jgi:hypothetical protein
MSSVEPEHVLLHYRILSKVGERAAWAAVYKAEAQSGDTEGTNEHSNRAREIVNSIAANVTDESLRNNFLTSARAAIAQRQT